MTDPIAEALERLGDHSFGASRYENGDGHDMSRELAALIRSNNLHQARNYGCANCGERFPDHHPSCALLALCNAIAGRKV